MKMTAFFKYFSLASLTGSAAVYCMPLSELEFNLNYFLVFHLTSMVAFFGIFFHSYKKRKNSKNNPAQTSSNQETFKNLGVLVTQNTGYIFALIICMSLIIFFMQFHAQNFMANIGSNNSDPLSFIQNGSGHWIVFSGIPTIYFALLIPLIEAWERINNG